MQIPIDGARYWGLSRQFPKNLNSASALLVKAINTRRY
jgi:hypothetical protein